MQFATNSDLAAAEAKLKKALSVATVKVILGTAIISGLALAIAKILF